MRQLESIEHFADHGKVAAGCGHEIDVRRLIYVHVFKAGHEVGVRTCCPACSDGLAEYNLPSTHMAQQL